MMSGVSGLLLAAVGGYWVLERAATHKGNLKRIGQLVGGVIIIASLVGVACRVWCLATCPSGVMGKKGTCPYITKSPAPSTTSSNSSP